MLRTFALGVLLLMVVSPAGLSAGALALYVATNGNDGWSGRYEKPVHDGKDGPLATLPAALRAARTTRRVPGEAADRFTIFLRGGTHVITEPIVLGPEDSGSSPGNPFCIASFAGEKPVISGGRRIVGWSRVEGKPDLWQVRLQDVAEGKWYFRQLFLNGRRMQRARIPRAGYLQAEGEYLTNHPIRFKFRGEDIRREWIDSDVELIALHKWIDVRQFIRAVDFTNRVVTLSADIAEHVKEPNARYYLENSSGPLDSAGEWHLDRRSGILSFHAPPGEDLNREEIMAPFVTTALLKLEGDFTAKSPVQHVILRGLAFAHTDWTLPENGYMDTQAAVPVGGDVLLEGATDCLIEGCTFSHLGGYALELGKGCQRCRVAGNEMFDIGAGGIRIGEPTRRQDAFELNYGYIINDNHLHQLGRVYAPAVGMIIFHSGQNRVAHNHIHDLYYTAISIGWNWGYQETPCRDNLVEFNHLHDIGQGVLSDMGGIYTLGMQPGTILRNNLIHDVSCDSYGGWGLYPDEGSTGIVLENNLVYRCKSAGFHQHYGRANVVRNNVFAFGAEHQLVRTREEEHLSFIFTNNIVYFDSGDLLGSNWSNDHYQMDHNLYFDARPDATAGALRFAGATLDQWRQRGHDQHSRIADPQFLAPGENDFRLKQNSPALKLGFKPVDPAEIGVRKRYKKQVHDTD